jgi:hypothetical protein
LSPFSLKKEKKGSSREKRFKKKKRKRALSREKGSKKSALRG